MEFTSKETNEFQDRQLISKLHHVNVIWSTQDKSGAIYRIYNHLDQMNVEDVVAQEHQLPVFKTRFSPRGGAVWVYGCLWRMILDVPVRFIIGI